MKYIVDIKGEIEGDYEIIGKYEEKPHRGTWVLNCKRYYCSECGEEAIDLESEPDVYGHNYCLTKCCPNCGANMRGEEE